MPYIVLREQIEGDELAKYSGLSPAGKKLVKEAAEVFDFLAHHTKNSYVLTNCLADTQEDRELYGQVQQMAQARGSF